MDDGQLRLGPAQEGARQPPLYPIHNYGHGWRGRCVLPCTLWLLATALSAAAEDFHLATQGCPMAHCDPRMSDQVLLDPPRESVAEIWHRDDLDSERAGSDYGLGCSSNGTIVACSYAGSPDALVVYDYDGNRLWTSGDLFNASTWTSAPMVSDSGEVIMADDTTIARLGPDGEVIWSSPMIYGGRAISPVITANGTLVIGTDQGPVYAFDSNNGALLDTLFVRKNPGDSGHFVTLNTPAVKDNRVYLSMHHQKDGVPDDDNLAWLVAIDVEPQGPAVLQEAWHFTFGGPSGASPLRVGNGIFFDGGRPAPSRGPPDPVVFAVVDKPEGPVEMWRQASPNPVVASLAQDPRPMAGVWGFSRGNAWLLRRSLFTGKTVQALNVNTLLGAPSGFVVSGALSIAGSATAPVLLVSATQHLNGVSKILAIDLNSSSLIWSVDITDYPPDIFVSQAPIINGPQGPRIILTTFNGGARAIGELPPESGSDVQEP